jgi:hypothetical protein
MNLPGARVDRASYLRDQLRSHCNKQQVRNAIETNPARAGVRRKIVNRIAKSAIDRHVGTAATISFAAGLPVGPIGLVTIPLDTAQYLANCFILAQKLAYIYGWPDLLNEDGSLDDETILRIAMLLGTMFGIKEANQALAEVAKRFAIQVANRLPKYALTKTIYYPVLKKALKWIGIRLTKQTFARGVSRFIPFMAGAFSAGITTITLRQGANNLQKHLSGLEYAKQKR